MDTHDARSRTRRPTLVRLLMMLSAGLVLATGFAAGTAQTPQETQAQSEEEERRFENGIPAHVPVKVKLRNEQAFKNPKNKEWGRDLEIEVRNTGTKPIYFMYMVVDLPDFLLEDGNPVGFQVKYGRGELVLMDTPVLPDDVPILPGESVTLKIRENSWQGFKAIRDKKNKADPKKVRFDLQLINFGDGTGLQSTKGEPTPNPHRKRSQSTSPPSQGAGLCQPPPGAGGAESPLKFLKASYPTQPADLLRADFFEPEEPLLPAPPARACNCQNIANCFFGKFQCANQCPCNNNCELIAHVSTGNCSDPFGSCQQVEMRHEPCGS
jgi:hypothetical protein